MAKKTTKNRSWKTIVFRVAFLCGMLYLAITLISGQVEVSNKKVELQQISQQVTQQQQETQELENLMNSSDEDAFVERMAREELGYTYYGERVYIDASAQEN